MPYATLSSHWQTRPVTIISVGVSTVFFRVGEACPRKRPSSRIVNHHKKRFRKAMAAMDTVLFNDPEVKRLAYGILEECTDLQAFGKKMLELMMNSAMSARADEACNAAYGKRNPERENSRNGYRIRGAFHLAR